MVTHGHNNRGNSTVIKSGVPTKGYIKDTFQLMKGPCKKITSNTIEGGCLQDDPHSCAGGAGSELVSCGAHLCNWCNVEHNMWSTSSVKSLLSGSNFPVAPLVAGLVTLQLFQNASLEFSWYFLYVFSFLVL